LVAYILPDGEDFDEHFFREQLLLSLPAYMVPGIFVRVANFMYLPSGKIDKKQLPEPLSLTQHSSKDTTASFAFDPYFLELAKILTIQFPGQILEPEMDFFEDLGGHSMLAAVFVSELRSLKGLSNISIIDIYQHKKLKEIFQCWKEKSIAQSHVKEQASEFKQVSQIQYYTCWFAQTIALFFYMDWWPCKSFFLTSDTILQPTNGRGVSGPF